MSNDQNPTAKPQLPEDPARPGRAIPKNAPDRLRATDAIDYEGIPPEEVAPEHRRRQG